MKPSYLCDDCGAQATVATSRVSITRPGQPSAKPTEHRYCRSCADLHGVPRRHPRPQRTEPKQIDWAGLQRFYELLETVPIDAPDQRAALRETVLQFREFLQHVPQPVPAELHALIDRLVERSA